MARRRKGNPVHGWLVIDKPLGVTSAAVVNKARWALDARKAGHAGTLDPLATGVLAVAFGEATKTVALAQEGVKTYRFTVRLGQATATDDAEGAVIAESDARPTDAEIRAALGAFEGDIMQTPPRFSAIKVAGERAYDLAREGEQFALVARPLRVHRIAMVARPNADHAEIEMTCGKGGYVRSVARDLGEALGCHGHVSALRRIASGAFRVEDAIPFDRLDAIRDGAPAPLLPVEAGLSEFPCRRADAADAARLANGQAIALGGLDITEGDLAWIEHERRPRAIVERRGPLLQPVRVFNFEDDRPQAPAADGTPEGHKA